MEMLGGRKWGIEIYLKFVGGEKIGQTGDRTQDFLFLVPHVLRTVAHRHNSFESRGDGDSNVMG